MESMFKGCKKLKLIDLSNFDTSKVTKMNNMFYGCTSLRFLDISYFNMGETLNIKDMFYNLKYLIYINIYNVHNYKILENEIRGNNGLNKKIGLNVCQKNNIINNKNIYHKCCDDFNNPKKCNFTNYIRVKYGYYTAYNIDDGINFVNSYRQLVSFIIYRNSLLWPDDIITIDVNSEIEIYFTSPPTSLESFFDKNYDQNVENIISVDLSNLNWSLLKSMTKLFFKCDIINSVNFTNFKALKVETMRSMFGYCNYLASIDLSSFVTPSLQSTASMFMGCGRLTSVNLSSFDTTRVTDMSSMFYGCGLVSVDLSNFDTSLVQITQNMFSDCDDLKSLNIPNFNGASITSMNNMFKNCYSLVALDISNLNPINLAKSPTNFLNSFITLNYINLYNISNPALLNALKQSYNYFSLNNKNGLYVCQKDIIINNPNAIYICCDFNIKTSTCSPKNYIIIHYSKDTIYENGFLIEDEDFENNREHIEFILNNGSFIYPKQYLEIKGGSNIKISLSKNIKSLAHFFDSKYDKNVLNISSTDFTYFDSTLITDMNSLFKGCNNLNSVMISNMNTKKVTNMSYLFSGCSQLQLIDLSSFNTENVIDMTEMFSGCVNLKYLDLINFNLIKLENSIENMFNDVNNLEFINLYNAQNIYNNFTNSKVNSIDNLIVCQKNKITDYKNAINKCGYYDLNTKKIDYTNYILLYYEEYVEYESGFIKDLESRKNIDFIVTGDHNNKIKANESLIIYPGQKVEIYFSSNIDDLKSFFDALYDSNTINIVSKDFSNFNSSSVKNMEKMLNGCSSLKYINFLNFDSSSVTNMSALFSGCSELKKIEYLQNFDTSSVIDMHNIFFGCTNLKMINLNDFNMHKIITAFNMFKGLDNLRYISLYGTNNSFLNITETNVNKKDNLYVCQNDEIITNPKAHYCCNYNFITDQCEYISSTMLLIGTSFITEAPTSIKLTEYLFTTEVIDSETDKIFTTNTQIEKDSTNIPINEKTTLLQTTTQIDDEGKEMIFTSIYNTINQTSVISTFGEINIPNTTVKNDDSTLIENSEMIIQTTETINNNNMIEDTGILKESTFMIDDVNTDNGSINKTEHQSTFEIKDTIESVEKTTTNLDIFKLSTNNDLKESTQIISKSSFLIDKVEQATNSYIKEDAKNMSKTSIVTDITFLETNTDLKVDTERVSKSTSPTENIEQSINSDKKEDSENFVKITENLDKKTSNIYFTEKITNGTINEDNEVIYKTTWNIEHTDLNMNSVLKEDTESVSKTSTNINIIEHETKTDIKEYSESIIKKNSNIDISEFDTNSDLKTNIGNINKSTYNIDNIGLSTNSNIKEDSEKIRKSTSNIDITEVTTDTDEKEKTESLGKTSSI